MGSSHVAAAGDPGRPAPLVDQLRAESLTATSTPSSSPSPTCRAGCRASGSTPSSSSTTCWARHRGLQLPAGRRRRHEHRRRLRHQLLGARLRRLRVRARPRHAAPGARGTRAPRWSVPTWPGSTTRRSSRVPRQILQRQPDRLAERGLAALRRHRARVHRLQRHLRAGLGLAATATSPPRTSTTSTTRSSAPAGSSRCCATSATAWTRAGLVVESAKGECNLGQHEIALPLRRGAAHLRQPLVYKTGAKEIAAQHGMALTFMAKFDEREGNSCHIHLSLRGADGRRSCSPTTATERTVRLCDAASSPGMQATLRELTLLYAPNINSYKRFQPGCFAPTAIAWGHDNRTCSLRLVGHGAGLRLENRRARRRRQPLPRRGRHGRRGLHGIEHGLRARAGVRRQRLHLRRADKSRRRCATRATLSHGSSGGPGGASATRWSTTTSTCAASSCAAFDAAVTDWERVPRLRADVTAATVSHVHRPHDVINPATEEVVADRRARRPSSETDAAIARARRALPRPGARVAPADRARLLRRFADAGRRARRGARRPGGAQRRAHASATRAGRRATSATCSHYYSAAPERLFGRQIPVAGGIDVTFKEPLGVVGVIVPWNFPMPIAGWGFAPALAAGNTVVLKPAEMTPLTAIRLGELALEAGLPEDVFTVLPGKGSVVGRAVRDAPAGAQGRVHRLDRGRHRGSWPAAPSRSRR